MNELFIMLTCRNVEEPTRFVTLIGEGDVITGNVLESFAIAHCNNGSSNIVIYLTALGAHDQLLLLLLLVLLFVKGQNEWSRSSLSSSRLHWQPRRRSINRSKWFGSHANRDRARGSNQSRSCDLPSLSEWEAV